MSEIVRETHRLNQISVDKKIISQRTALRTQIVANRATYLRNFH